MKKHLGTLAIAAAVCMTLGDAAQAGTMGYSEAKERMILKGLERPSSAIHREKISHRRTVAHRKSLTQRRMVSYREQLPLRRTMAFREHIPSRRTVAFREHLIPHRRTVAYRTHFIPHRRTVAYRTHFIPHRRTVAYRWHFPHRRVVAFQRPMMVQRTVMYQPAPIASYEPVTYREPSTFGRILTWPGRAAVTAVRTPLIIGETAAGQRTFVNESGQFFGRRDLAAYRPAVYQPTYVARPAARRLSRMVLTSEQPEVVRTTRTVVQTPVVQTTPVVTTPVVQTPAVITGETLSGRREIHTVDGSLLGTTY